MSTEGIVSGVFKYAHTELGVVIQLQPGLSEIEKTALLALADAANWSPNAHPPIEAITSKVASHLRGDLKKAIQRLKRRGYCLPHPTRGGITWQPTHAGLEIALSLTRSRSTAYP